MIAPGRAASSGVPFANISFEHESENPKVTNAGRAIIAKIPIIVFE